MSLELLFIRAFLPDHPPGTNSLHIDLIIYYSVYN